MTDCTGLRYGREALDALRRKWPRWMILFRTFADGDKYDAVPLDEGRPRLVKETAAGLDEVIAAVEDGTWQPGD